MSESETALQKFQEPALTAPNRELLDCSKGTIVCRIRNNRDYDQAGLLLSTLRRSKKQWTDYLKQNPQNKKPSECTGLECVYYFAYQSLERAKKIVNDGVAWFDPREAAVARAIRDYDERKQEELRRKQEAEEKKRREAEIAAEEARQQEERKRLEAERKAQDVERARVAAESARNDKDRKIFQAQAAKAEAERLTAEAASERERRARIAHQSAIEAAERRQQAAADQAGAIARGPEGTIKVTTFVPTVADKAAFLRWLVRTENWHLAEVAAGNLKKHVNALAGRNLPDGVSVRREDVIRRTS